MKSENAIPHTQETYEIPVTTKEDPTYEMLSHEMPSSTNNYYESVGNSSVDNTMMYDVPKPQASYRVGHFK